MKFHIKTYGYQMNELTANLVYSARQTLEAALRHLARS